MGVDLSRVKGSGVKGRILVDGHDVRGVNLDDLRRAIGVVFQESLLFRTTVAENIAAGYAISYILSSIGIILLIRYLPQMFGRDPVADAKVAEEAFSGGGTHAVPDAPDSLALGFSPLDLRAYRVEHADLVGKTGGPPGGRRASAFTPTATPRPARWRDDPEPPC